MFFNKIRRLLVKIKSTKCVLSISYFISFIVLAGYFVIKLTLCQVEKDKEYYQILHKTQRMYLEGIQNEIAKIFDILEIAHNTPHNVEFLRRNLLLNFIRVSNIIEHYYKPFELQASPNILEITAGFYTVQTDIQLLRQFISKNIPQNINFKIYINNQAIVGNGEKSNIFIENTTASSFSSVITLLTSIKKDFLSKDKNKIIRAQILEIGILIIPIIIINFIFRRIYIRSILRNFKDMKLSYSDLMKERNSLLQLIKTKSKWNELIITKIKQRVKNKALKADDALDDILYFPLLLEEDQHASIESVIFFEDLISSLEYSLHKKKVDFRYLVTGDIFTVRLSKESFYQLIFSLVHNVLHLSSNKSSLMSKSVAE